MNVKRQIFEKDKENTNHALNSQYSAPFNKGKTNIGEEIRKKLKIKPNQNDSQLILMQRNQNNFVVDDKQKIEKKPFGPRTNIMQRSVDVDRSTSRSVKSVRFEASNNSNLTRKHSTSSILKHTKETKKPRFSDKMSINNSVCSNILKEDQSIESISFNKIIKQKYERCYEQVKKIEKKYADQLFPPIWSSICRISNPHFKHLEWMRLSQIFAGKFITVWDYNETVKIMAGQFSKNNILPNCLNSIKHNSYMLEKMFQSQKFNQHGIYYVKICQNNSWKYVILDDYIPVFKRDKKFVPAFLNVECSNAQHIQLWPFLIQKAYAKYYSNYECLELGSQIELLQQITGCLPQEKTPSKDLQEITMETNNYDSILIAKGYNGKFYPIVSHKSALICEDPCLGYAERLFSPQQFKQQFQKVYCILLHKFFYSGYCTIKYNHKSESDNQMSLRCINIEDPTQCVISLAQKDIKHYYLGDYKYTWARLIVVMKESDKNYRWIAATYANTKYVNLSMWLEPGEYIIIVIPEWNSKGYDLNLTYQGNLKVRLDRKPYIGNQRILIEAAMDLAQSKGKLKQLNSSICTYSYIQQNIGFIIENINNQRPNGFVRILRSIEGLQQSGENLIKAFNIQFKDSNTIEAKIDCLQHFTVVLGVVGGINKAFLEQFDFGS